MNTQKKAPGNGWGLRLLFGLLVGYALLFTGGQSAQAATTTGTWGTVPWSFESTTGELTFTGGGALGTYSSSPWGTSQVGAGSIGTITFTSPVIAPVDSRFLFSGTDYRYFLGSLTKINNLDQLDTSNATNMSSMFMNDGSLTTLDVTHFDTSKVTNMANMFVNCQKLTTLDVTHFDTTNVTNMSAMFSACRGLVALDVTHFNTSNVTNMSNMFISCSSLSALDVIGFDTTKVTTMNGMFQGCSALASLDVTHFNTSQVTTMSYMFNACSSLPSLDVTHLDTTNVRDMSYMFSGCSKIPLLDVTNFNTSRATNMGFMFYGCSSLPSLDVTHFDTTNVTNMGAMFQGCSGLPALNVTLFNTTKVTNMSNMFYGCSSLPSLDVTHFDTTNVTGMGSMFRNCSSLLALDVTNFNTTKVANMEYMFQNCSSLPALDVSHFDTANVTNMRYMFSGCSGLPALDVTNFNTARVAHIAYMFGGCTKLSELDLSNFTYSSISQAGYELGSSGFLRDITSVKKLILNAAFPAEVGRYGGIALPTIPTTSGEYSGRWVATSGIGLGTTYANSTTLTTTYTADKAGTYEWEPNQTSLTVKDTTIQTIDSWQSVDNLVTVTDAYGAAVDLSSSQITTTGTVNPQQAGTYTVTYRYTSVNKTVTAVATITVVDTPAHVTVQFVRDGQVLPENTVTLTEHNVWNVVNLTTDTTVQHQVQLLEAAGYEVTAPTNAAAYSIREANPTVQYQVTGVLRLQSAPDTIDFGTIAYSGKKERLDNPTLTGGALAISDTRSDTTTGWVLSAKLTQVMTNTTTNGVLSNALVYVRDATDYILTTEALPIYTKSDGGSLTVSDTWTEQTEGLKLEIDPATNQLDKGTYTGKILWLISAGTP